MTTLTSAALAAGASFVTVTRSLLPVVTSTATATTTAAEVLFDSTDRGLVAVASGRMRWATLPGRNLGPVHVTVTRTTSAIDDTGSA